MLNMNELEKTHNTGKPDTSPAPDRFLVSLRQKGKISLEEAEALHESLALLMAKAEIRKSPPTDEEIHAATAKRPALYEEARAFIWQAPELQEICGPVEQELFRNTLVTVATISALETLLEKTPLRVFASLGLRSNAKYIGKIFRANRGEVDPTDFSPDDIVDQKILELFPGIEIPDEKRAAA